MKKISCQTYSYKYNKFTAMDLDKRVFEFDQAPMRNLGIWTGEDDTKPYLEITDKVIAPDCDWEDSLTEPLLSQRILEEEEELIDEIFQKIIENCNSQYLKHVHDTGELYSVEEMYHLHLEKIKEVSLIIKQKAEELINENKI